MSSSVLGPLLQYQQSLFFSDQVVFVNDNVDERPSILKQWHWSDLSTQIQEWMNRSRELPTTIRDLATKEAKETIEKCYAGEYTGNARGIARGPASLKRHGVRDLPHNLPGGEKARRDFDVTVFIQMLPSSRSPQRVEYVVAFPHHDWEKLPLTKGSTMARQRGSHKVLNLPVVLYSYREYCFCNLEHLMSEYFERFPRDA